MGADSRVTYRRRHSINTKSNYFKKVKTPGHRLVIHYLKKLHLKQRSLPKCAETKTKLRGVIPNRGNYKNRRLTKIQQKRKRVSRIYGGYLCHQAVRNRIIRAFLSEEVRAFRLDRRLRKKRKEEKKAKMQRKRQIYLARRGMGGGFKKSAKKDVAKKLGNKSKSKGKGKGTKGTAAKPETKGKGKGKEKATKGKDAKVGKKAKK